MATLRKANAYSKKRVVPYTRKSKVKSKSYVKAVPSSKIVKFIMGSGKPEKLKHRLTVVSLEDVQLRHNALESCRQYLNRQLDKKLSGNYYFKVIPYPHHIQRENKMLTGAGSDRMQTGMQLSYGKAVGRSALIKKNSQIFVVEVADKNAVEFTRKILRRIKSKLPCKSKVNYKLKE